MKRRKVTDGSGALNPQVFHTPDIAAPCRYAGPHGVEKDVQRELLAEPQLHFSSLVIHRVPNGVCIEGVVAADADSPDISRVARRVAGVETVIDRVLITQSRPLPPKG